MSFTASLPSERRGVSLLPHRFVVAIPVQHAVLFVREVIDLADHRAVLVIEAALLRPVFPVGMAEMPLADDRGLVARLLQALRQQPFVVSQAVGGDREDDRGLQAVAERIAARHQAARVGVHIGCT